MLAIVFDYCPGGTLAQLIASKGTLEEMLARLYAAEILLALEYLDERCIVHRDMKAENVLLDRERHAILADFGLCKAGVDQKNPTNTFCGSVSHIAPEVLARSEYDTSVDIYGLGVVTFEMLCGDPPFFSKKLSTKQLHHIRHVDLSIPDELSTKATSFLRQLLERDPSERLGFQCIA